MKRPTSVLLGLLVVTASSTAQQTIPDRVETIAGATHEGAVESIDEAGEVVLRPASGEVRREPLNTVYRIALAAAEAKPAASPLPTPRLWLRSGQTLPAVLRDGNQRAAEFELAAWDQRFEIPWRFVQALRFGEDQEVSDPGFLERAADPPDDRDYLYARAGEAVIRRLSVQFVGMSEGKVTVRFGGEERTMPVDRVYGIVFGKQSGARPDAQPNPRVTLVLDSTQRITGKLSRLDADQCRLRLDEGVTFAVPRARVRSILVRSDKMMYLTELEPHAVDQTAAFDRVWPWLRNRGPGGGDIRMGGEAYRFGLVLFPRTRLTYRIDGRFDVFEAVIGLEERAGERAHAVFRVIGDGRVLHDSGPITPDNEPRRVKVPVTDVRDLTVEADFGQDFDLGDICVFAMPRVLKN